MSQASPETKPRRPQRSDFRFSHRLRVRWAEVDIQKIVFNAHYLTYFDTAIADYWRALALPYEESMHALGGDLYVKKVGLEYHASARMDDRLDVALRCARIGNSSMSFAGAIFRADQLLIECELLYVFADPPTQTSRPVPQALRDILLGYEQGQEMVEVRVGRWRELAEPATRIRHQVFVREQGVPIEMELDELDEGALHVVAFNRLGAPVATGRLLQAQAGVVRIGRMAVHEVLRGSGIAQRVMAALVDAAAARGDREVLLHAQVAARSFYERLGFQARGEEFEEAGITHVEMTRAIA